MSGHSKWSTIKRKKGAQDAKRGVLFSKLIKEITVAAKMGGDDINSNPRLKTAIAKAKENNMPNDNIERAIKKGSGALGDITYEEVRYEGFGPGGVAIMVDCLTDNKNRTTPEIRTLFSKHGGNLGESGSVSYLFDRKGLLIVEGSKTSEEELMENLIDFGIEDIKSEDKNIVITTEPESYNDIYDILKNKNLELVFSEITQIPKTTVALDEKKASQCLNLIDYLEGHDDTQNVYSNYDISDEILKKISEEQ
ncbi:MAG: YebC/PmpR family DNA-binding transcriptional regulator [Spirochaetes bacterium]|nr:YebC/PmpR family DNA-binding transcriptional regulator [Spirochaetota bacterium]